MTNTQLFVADCRRSGLNLVESSKIQETMQELASLGRMLEKIRRSRNLGEGAVPLSRELFRIVSEGAAEGGFPDAVPRFVSVHIRPDGGYTGLVVVDATEAAPITGARAIGALKPSMSAWRMVSELRLPLSVDVRAGNVAVIRHDTEEIERHNVAGIDTSSNTINRLTSRATTHLLAIPILSTEDECIGMISVEVSCESAVNSHFVWPTIGELLAAVVQASSALLAQLPGYEATTEENEFLPVAGRRMTEVLSSLRKFTLDDETILLRGPSGVGKTRLARSIHRESHRANGPFQVADLKGMSEEQAAATLFGAKKGAYTGLTEDRSGHVEKANGGTLFIDEVDKLSLVAQATLLRFLDEREYTRFGDTETLTAANVRFIIGTNADLEQAIAVGTFLQDLYFRINIMPVHVPPLNERRDEISAWAEHFAASKHHSAGRTGRTNVSRGAIVRLEGREWPGNLRELDTVVRRAYQFAAAESDQLQNIEILDRHVSAAVAMDSPHGTPQTIELLENAAGSLIEEAVTELGREGFDGVDVRGSNILYALTWAAAIRRFGNDHEMIAKIVGKDRSLATRNYRKELRREMTRLAEFYRVRGASVPEDLEETLASMDIDLGEPLAH